MLIALPRVFLGSWLFVHYMRLFPYAADTFSDAGMLPDPAQNPAWPFAPSPLAWFAAPWLVRALVAALASLALSYTVGFRTRTSGALLGIGAFVLFHRNQLTLNPSLAFLGFWFLVQLFTAADPPWSLDRRLARAADPTAHTPNRLPPDVLRALWIVHAAAYSFSGWTKLMSPSWRSGRAIGMLLNGPIGLDNPVARMVVALPDAVHAALTWGVVGLELLYAPLALARPVRPWLWVAVLAMHVGILVTVDLEDISLGMIAAHLFLFDPRWIPRPAKRLARAWMAWLPQLRSSRGGVRTVPGSG